MKAELSIFAEETMQTVLKNVKTTTKVMTLREIAEFHSVTPQTVRRWIDHGYLRTATQIGTFIVCSTTDAETVRDRIPPPGRRSGHKGNRAGGVR